MMIQAAGKSRRQLCSFAAPYASIKENNRGIKAARNQFEPAT
jgi:hypothetical protein